MPKLPRYVRAFAHDGLRRLHAIGRQQHRDDVDDNSRHLPRSVDAGCQTANVLAKMQADLRYKNSWIEELHQQAEDRSQEVRRLNRNSDSLLESLRCGV